MMTSQSRGIALIVFTTLVTTATAYTLLTRAFGDIAPSPADSSEPQRAQEPSEALARHEAAVDTTVACLAAAGMAPQESDTGESVTRITVDASRVDSRSAQAIIDDCRRESGVSTIATVNAVDVLRAPLRASSTIQQSLLLEVQ